VPALRPPIAGQWTAKEKKLQLFSSTSVIFVFKNFIAKVSEMCDTD